MTEITKEQAIKIYKGMMFSDNELTDAGKITEFLGFPLAPVFTQHKTGSIVRYGPMNGKLVADYLRKLADAIGSDFDENWHKKKIS